VSVEETDSDTENHQDSQLPFGLDSEPQLDSANLLFGLEETPASEDPETLVFGIESSPVLKNRDPIPFGLDESPSSED